MQDHRISQSSRVAALLVVLAGLLATAAPATAAPPKPGAYQEHDYGHGRVFNIAPPGQNGFESLSDVAAFEATGIRPPHQNDQTDMYANLVYKAPNLKNAEIGDYFKDASFGVPGGDVTGTTNPQCAVIIPPSPNSAVCGDVTITRDNFGVPHIYGRNRAALMFGIGYTTGHDRMFLADVLRHGGRAELASFVGGANLAQDEDTFRAAPYTSDEELQQQIEQADDLYGKQGKQIQEDIQNYTDGMNQWIAESRFDPVDKLDALYPATGHATGPDPWKPSDVVAAGALVAGIFGKGGGGEVGSTLALQDAQAKFGHKKGRQIWLDFQSGDDPEAPRTVHKQKFPYRAGKGMHGAAIPDPGTVEHVPTIKPASGTSAAQAARAANPAQQSGELGNVLGPLAQTDGPPHASNALLVSARESAGGHPVAVIGPQTGYFAPQLLMEEDIHAPATKKYGPAIDARGVSFTATNLYVELGRGQDYSFSATSAGQDITDTFAVKLCERDGSKPTIDSMSYVWRGKCLPMTTIERHESWTPNLADSTPSGSATLQAFRTNAGLVSDRALIGGKPYAYTSLRATYKREVDSARSFADWNSPDVVHNEKSWAKAGYSDDLTFNWFYVDDKDIGYYNSGANPVRGKGTPTHFPVFARKKFMWKGYNPTLNTFKREPFARHAQVRNQRYLTSWNNKQAKGYNCDSVRCYTPVFRSDALDQRIKPEIKGHKKMSLVELINAMEDAGTVDIRGATLVPWALRVLESGKHKPHGELAKAIKTMHAWVHDGAHRRDRNNDGSYDAAEAVKDMDAWYPLWVEGEFKPTLRSAYDTFVGGIHDAPGPIGSAFDTNFYGYINKDLRSALGARVKAPYSRVYCGKGKLGSCRKMLRKTLLEATHTGFDDLYGTSGCTLNNGTKASPQMCHDAVNPTDITAAPVGQFHWINRPTFQQAVQYTDGR